MKEKEEEDGGDEWRRWRRWMRKMEDMSKRRRRRRGKRWKEREMSKRGRSESTRMDLVLGRLRKGGGGEHQWTKRGRSRGTQSLPRSWLLTHWGHIRYARKRAVGYDDGSSRLNHAESLTWWALASDLGWKEGETSLESPPSLPRPSHFELR